MRSAGKMAQEAGSARPLDAPSEPWQRRRGRAGAHEEGEGLALTRAPVLFTQLLFRGRKGAGAEDLRTEVSYANTGSGRSTARPAPAPWTWPFLPRSLRTRAKRPGLEGVAGGRSMQEGAAPHAVTVPGERCGTWAERGVRGPSGSTLVRRLEAVISAPHTQGEVGHRVGLVQGAVQTPYQGSGRGGPEWERGGSKVRAEQRLGGLSGVRVAGQAGSAGPFRGPCVTTAWPALHVHPARSLWSPLLPEGATAPPSSPGCCHNRPVTRARGCRRLGPCGFLGLRPSPWLSRSPD